MKNQRKQRIILDEENKLISERMKPIKTIRSTSGQIEAINKINK